MKPTEQTLFGNPDGNCFAACVASILELPLEVMPNYKGREWLGRWNHWLAPLNLCIAVVPADGKRSAWPEGAYCILSAKSPRGDFYHAVVAKDGQVVFDPHPERDMGLGEWSVWYVFVACDPAKPHGFRAEAAG